MALTPQEIGQAIAKGIRVIGKLPRWKKLNTDQRLEIVAELGELTATLAIDIAD